MPKSFVKGERLRICVICFMFFPLVGGSEVQAEKHARQLQALGHDVTVVTLRINKQWAKTEIIDGLPVVRVGGWYRRNGLMHIGRFGRPFLDFATFLTLWRMRNQYDIVHCMQLSSIGAAATLVCKLTQKPIILSIQSAGPNKQQQARIQQNGPSLMADTITTIEPDFLKVSASDWVAGDVENLFHATLFGHAIVRFFKQSDAFYQVLSTRCQTYLTSQGFKPNHIERIPNGVDIDKFRPAPSTSNSLQPERNILCVSRLEYPKGVDVLLHAWGRMMNEPATWRAHFKPRLRIVGQGVFLPQMKRIVDELGIQESVEFLGLRRDTADLLRQSWGFVLPSRWEGMPNALLEAMACRLPCVATRVSGSEDLIKDGVNGLLVEPEQPAEMALALRRMIEDASLAQTLAQEAYTTIVHEYQLKTIVEQSIHLYYALLTQGRSVLPLVLEKGGGV
ncbi:MAG: glycosyltransferase family 4 protein [Ktedonobacteraceae bacterium]